MDTEKQPQEQMESLTEEYKIPSYFHDPKRQEDESYEDYKKRRYLSNWMVKEIKKGSVVWPSIMKNPEGQYVGITYDKDRIKQAMALKQAAEELTNVK